MRKGKNFYGGQSKSGIAQKVNGESRGNATDLREILNSIHRSQYPAYRSIRGAWELLPSVTLHVDRVQADPYAPPTPVRINVPLALSRFPTHLYSNQVRIVAFCDFLVRKFENGINQIQPSHLEKGSWRGFKGGNIVVDRPSQHVLQRSSCLIRDEHIEMRFNISLPARGRTIDGNAAINVMLNVLPKLLRNVIFADKSDEDQLEVHVQSIEQQHALRGMLLEKGLIAFVSDGSVLPRESGTSDKPLSGSEVVKYSSPPELRVSFTLAGGKVVSGMGIKPGVSLIVGGGFHGKSTLLSALQVGMYDHIPGDGREFVVIHDKTVSIRAEDGRCVTGVDITPFINNLPFEKSTEAFCTPDASGSTSQAANVVEAVEAGAKVFLIDEDLAATNFMIRDKLMQELVPDAKEPITPMINRIRSLYEEEGISTILVAGAAGNYFGVSDVVIMMDCYAPHDVTQAAKKIIEKSSDGLSIRATCAGVFKSKKKRSISVSSVRRLVDGKKVSAKTRAQISFGMTDIDVSALSQIVETGQTRAIAAMLESLSTNRHFEQEGITAAIDKIMSESDNNGIDAINVHGRLLGNYSRPRGLELQAALNRIRGIKLICNVNEGAKQLK